MTRVAVGRGRRRSQLSARNRPEPLAPQTQTPTTSGSEGRASPGAPLRVRGAAMGYVRAVGARVSFDSAADGDGGGGVELRAETKVKFSSRKMPESSISGSSCSSSFPTASCVGANSSASASPLNSLSSTSSSLARARMSGAMGTRWSLPRLAAPHHPYRALRERVHVLVYALPIERGVSGGGRDELLRAVGGGIAGGVREGAGRGEGGGGGRGRGVRGVGRAGALGRVGVGVGSGRRRAGGAGECERGGGRCALVLRREGEVRPEQARVDAGRAADALGCRTGTWKGEPSPPHGECRRALVELAEHQAHAGGAGGGVQVLHRLFALQGRVARRCAEGERERRGGGIGVEGGGDEGAELGEAEGREAGGRH
ncbi:hypothetical protein B0H14DRAFT_3175847 [Mycena olivaceomarginata]|nr:hypothetical protein B0H14DRAFT_3175847 [Mycena olivaceomarginata]